MAVKLSANDINDINGAECTVQLFETGESGVKLRGKKTEFKKDEDEPKDLKKEQQSRIKIQLGDCIQCSGCITSAEEIFLSVQNPEKLNELLQIGAVMMLTNQALLSLKEAFSVLAEREMTILQTLMIIRAKYPKVQLEPENHYQQYSSSLLIQDIFAYITDATRHETKPLMITHCPATRLFINKKQGNFNAFLSQSASSQEVFYALNDHTTELPLIVITSCQDRKLEAFKYENRFSFAANELLSLLEPGLDFSKFTVDCDPQNSFNAFCNIEHYSTAKDVIKTLLDNFPGATMSRGLNRDQNHISFSFNNIEFQFTHNQGIRNLENMCMKANNICNSGRKIFFLEACPRGCNGGAGLAAVSKPQLANAAKKLDEITVPVCLGTLQSFGGLKQINTKVEAAAVLSPEEILKQKAGVGAIKVTDMEW